MSDVSVVDEVSQLEGVWRGESEGVWYNVEKVGHGRRIGMQEATGKLDGRS